MITNLQLLRALAALSVVFYHTGYTIAGHSTEFYGVAIFFCISGFIMSKVTTDGEDNFFIRRLVRIVPLYWIATIAFFLLLKGGLLNLPYTGPLLVKWVSTNNYHALAEWVSNSFFSNKDGLLKKLIFSLFFLPNTESGYVSQPLLAVGWTLNLEMYFYVLFAVANRINRKISPLITTSFLLLVAISSLCIPKNPYLKFYGQLHILYFVFGIAIFYLYRNFHERWLLEKKGFISLATLAFFTSYVLWNAVIEGMMPFSLLAKTLQIVLPPLVVLVALTCHTAGVRISSPFPILLGGASYALYLTHIIFLEMWRPIAEKGFLPSTSHSLPAVVILVVLCSLFSILAHLRIEIPMHQFFKRVLIKR